jgi:heptosyltransferase-2
MVKICIIKLGAKGDVIRTLPLLVGIRKKYPESEITWITKENVKDLLLNVKEINKVITNYENYNDFFDILYNFDIDDEATMLAMKIKATEKKGFYSEDGYAMAFNVGAEYYINTMFDDSLKKANRKTYQEMMYDAAELSYNKEFLGFELNDESKNFASDFKIRNNISKKIIGIHMGAGSRWPSKAWYKENVKEFIKIAKGKGYEILLFGGPNEIEEHKMLAKELINGGIKILQNNPNNTDGEFAALIDLCSVVVCSDSFALHVALALKKKTVGLFFCTSPWEVEGYGLLTKIVSPLLPNFFPERSDEYNEDLVKSISPEEVLKECDS